MGEQDRLRPLQMRIARHNRIEVRLRLLEQRFLQLDQQINELNHALAQVEMHVRRHLIVAAAAGMQLAADRTDHRRSAFSRYSYEYLHSESRIPARRGESCRCTMQQAVLDFLHIVRRKNAAFAQHRHMRQAALNIFLGQLFIEYNRCCIFFDQLVGFLRKPSAPKLRHRA